VARSVFISFVLEDKAHFETVQQWAAAKKLGPDVVVIGETKDVRQDGEAAIRNHLKPRIEGSSAVLLLLGSDTHNHDWVRYELSVATSFHKKIVVVRIPRTSGAAPAGFQQLKEVPLDPGAIRNALA
jgi:hypothetical protein